jgi:TolB-like protein/tetratricopeptide (TPR) repeat protein/predicted Ser/Thr protein kinase
MQRNDWQEVENMFHAVLQLEADQRSTYLAEACSGKQWLLDEVNSLITAIERKSGFLEQSVLHLGLSVISSDGVESMVGKEIGPYKILRLLGKGGMGEVYLAEDTRLARRVALKFISQEFVQDNWAKRQLVKEAQAVAILDHPNICPVYGIELNNEHSFIVMQYVEGETLLDFIGKHSLTANQTLALAQQLVGAVAEAHAHGILHRDIKPTNIMVTPSGQAKVLDFGLAKTIQQKQLLETTPDSISHLTQSGFVPGTVAYMSPEQLRGEELDYRSDIFSLGTVLFEFATGQNPFARDSNAEMISAILTQDAPVLKNTASQIPRQFDRIVQKCLKKKLTERYQSASEVLSDLDSLQRKTPGRRTWEWVPNLRITAALILSIFLIALGTFAYFRLTRPLAVAVLPIVNESGDPTLEYIGAGLTENLINKLSGLTKLRVRPLTVVSGYKGQAIDPKKVGHDLNVNALLLGRLKRAKDGVVLETTLVSVADGSQLWVEHYEIEPANIISIEQEISQKVISRLELWSSTDEIRIESAHRVQNPEAHRLYMLGRFYWKRRDGPQDIDQAIASFDEAIKLEPTYARAHAGLADCYVLRNKVAYGHMETKEAMTKAEAAAKEALDNDDTLPEAHTSLGVVNLNYHWNWREAERRFKRAIELNRDYAPAHYWYSNLLVMTGRAQEAIPESEIARDLDPFSPPSVMNFCRTLYFARRYDSAAECFNKLAQEEPNNTNVSYARGLVYLQQGAHADALKIFEALYLADKLRAGSALGYTYGVSGKREEALKVLDEMQELRKRSPIPPQEIALIYLGLGESDKAFTLFQQAAEEHFAPFAYLAVDPVLDKFHSDPRFIELMRRFNLGVNPS